MHQRFADDFLASTGLASEARPLFIVRHLQSNKYNPK